MILCLACAELLPDAEPGERCPNCRFQISAERYEELLAYAERLVRYGHQYRELYAGEFEAGRENDRHFLPPLHKAFNFVGLAILSGVVGNRADAAVQVVVTRIRQQLRDRHLVDGKVLESLDAEIDQLELHLIDLTTRPREIPRPVLSAILEEAVVDFSMELRGIPAVHSEADDETTIERMSFQQDLEAHKRALADAKRRLSERFLPPESARWDDLWKNAGA